MAHDVFISYSSKDKPWADAVTATLEANGVHCWIAPRDIPEGAEYPAALAAALRGSRTLVLIFSGASNESPQVLREVERSLALKIPLIPFRIENVPLSHGMEYLISTPQWLDVDPEAPEASVVRLVPAVQKVLAVAPLPLRDVVVPKLPKLVHAQRRLRQLRIALVMALAGLAVGFAAFRYATRGDSLLVMPFANASGQPDLDPYRVAFPLDIIAALSNLPDKFVTKPGEGGTLEEWAASNVTVAQASRTYDANKVLTAGFKPSGDPLAFHAELADAGGGAVWRYPSASPSPREAAEPCLKEPANRNRLLPLRRVVLEGILDNMRVSPSVADRKKVLDPPTDSCEAYDLYLEARSEWNKRSKSGFRRAIVLYEQATQVDPKFALAFAGLADCYNLLADYSIVRPTDQKEGFPAAQRNADRALALNAGLAEAHVSKAFYLFQYAWDWSGAEREFGAAENINSRYATGLQWKAVYYAAMGRHDEAIDQMTRAMRSDQQSPILATNRGWLLHLARRDAEAEQELRAVLQRVPDFEEAHRQLGDVYLTRGDHGDALREYAVADRLAVDHDRRGRTEYEALMARAAARIGSRESAAAAASEFEREYMRNYFPASYIALIYIALGDKDAAFRWLTQSVNDRSDEVILLNVDPAYDSIRGDSRFVDLVKRIGFP